MKPHFHKKSANGMLISADIFFLGMAEIPHFFGKH